MELISHTYATYYQIVMSTCNIEITPLQMRDTDDCLQSHFFYEPASFFCDAIESFLV
jgi:hypothetical protein